MEKENDNNTGLFKTLIKIGFGLIILFLIAKFFSWLSWFLDAIPWYVEALLSFSVVYLILRNKD